MKRTISALLLFSVYITSTFQAAQPVMAQTMRKNMQNISRDTPDGLTFRLSEGKEVAETTQGSAETSSEILDKDATGKLLSRLSGIKSDPDDKTEFAKRVGTLPAPKTGNKIPQKFPSDADLAPPSNVANSGSLEVVRFSPEGEVALAPDLNVTFSQPMVAVTSQVEAAKYVPVELSPNVEGRWRWLGAKTLMFDTDKRFPMATKFTVRVPAGTRSATGQTLAKDVSWTFTTPPPKVETMVPAGGVTRRDALMMLRFDQAVDPASVLQTTKVTAGGKAIKIRLATQDEIASDSSIAYQIKDSQPGRAFAFRAVNADGGTENALPGNSTINVTVSKGTASAEGPLTTAKDQSFSFRTYGPFNYVKSVCGWESKNVCQPTDQWYLQFTNSIDSSKFAKESVHIEPEIPGVNIYPSGNNLYISGSKKGNTTYKVTVDPSLTDTFGQTLGKAAAATFKVGAADRRLYSQGGAMVLLDPWITKPSYSIYTTNQPSVNVKIYAVTPKDWWNYQNYYRHVNYDDNERTAMPGELVKSETVKIENKPDELVETRIDLSRFLKNGLGNLVLQITPTVPNDKYDRQLVLTWVEATQIGLDAFVDNNELVGFATDIKTGKPLGETELSIWPNGNNTAENESVEDKGFLATALDWVSSIAASGPSATSAFESDGTSAEIESIAPAQTNKTGSNGILRLSLPDSASNAKQNVLIARRGGDVAFLPESADYYWQQSGTWYKRQNVNLDKWFIFNDRNMYKPKEEVAVKGYVRHITGGTEGDVEAFGQSRKFDWSAKDSNGNEIAKGSIETNTFGAFDLKFNIPDNANLGYAQVYIFQQNNPNLIAATHQFQIQEFRRPEFEVKAKVETMGPYIIGQSALIGVDAKYYAGGGLANADATWTVTANQTNYTPPNRGEYTFGTWTPWWGGYYSRSSYGGGTTQTFKGKTDAGGHHLLKVDLDSVKPPRPYTITASAAVMDVNRQTWSGSTSLLVHPSSLYVGIQTPRTFVQKGDPINVETIVSDIDGKLVAGREVEVTAVLKDWQFDKGTWQEKIVDEQTCSTRSTDVEQKCTFTAKAGGRYIITARVMDDLERFNESEITVWVPGGKEPPKRSVEQETAQVIPSKKDYAPGDTAELLVISPFGPAEGVLTLRRDGLVSTERFTIKDSSITLKVPLQEKYLPNIIAQVDLVGSAPRQNDKGEVDPKLANRPAFATGNIDLKISTDSRKLDVTAEAREKTLAPGGSTKVDVTVKDATGRAVGDTEVALVVVDESVLALSGYSIADPLAFFYTARSSGVTDYHSRKDLLLGNPTDAPRPLEPPSPVGLLEVTANSASDRAEMMGGAVQSMKARSPAVSKQGFSAEGAVGDDKDSASDGGAITVRQDLNALALWSPTVKTDASGKAVVDLKLPDNLTRYRVTAVAVDAAKRFGKTESDITAKQPLMVRPSAPRFLNFGDKAEVPVVIQNQTDKDMSVNVGVRGTNVTFTGEGAAAADNDGVSSAGKRVVVKANDRAEVRFPVSTVKAGTARFQFAASSGTFSDAAEISLPVWTPATTEAFATYGSTDQNGAIVQPVQTPGDVWPQFGGLEVTTSSTQLQELTDAFISLYRYPFECSEQISSRMISTAALQDVLSAFKSKDMPTRDELNARFARDIEILKSRQRSDGSFGLWTRDRERYEYPFLTVHVAHALVLAKAKGYKVPDDMLNKVKPYLKDVEKHFDQYYTSPEVKWTISAYALYVRDMMGDKDAGKAKKMLAEAKAPVSAASASNAFETKLPFEALGWILSVIANDPGSAGERDQIIRYLMNHSTETASTANFVTDYGDNAWLIMHSNRRADGVLLEALIKAQPHNDLIMKLVRGLLANRKKGSWGSTQENVFILLALDKYFQTFEKVTPDFVARVWLGNTYAGEQQFRGRSVDSNAINIPMQYLADKGGTSDLVIDKQGAGRMYYRIGMTYAPRDLNIKAADYGFTVLRRYEAVDDKDDVKQETDGSWTIKSGARVRVRLTMVAQGRRYHVALVDNLPAGFEILNPELATTEVVPADTGEGNTGVLSGGSRSLGRNYWWWSRNWFEHQNFRDERAEAFASLLWEGVYNYTYVARATTPGDFIAPPAKAEEMYAPETFGRTGTEFVHIR